MKKTLTALMMAFTLLVMSGGMSFAQDYQKGMQAFIFNDYATAVREWRPLAAQGDANAQAMLGYMYYNGKGVTQGERLHVSLEEYNGLNLVNLAVKRDSTGKHRIDELERSQGRGTHCLLYTDAWSEEQLATEVARLKQTYASVMTFLVDEDDLVGLVPMNTEHEDALKEHD